MQILSSNISKSARRKWKHYGIVPKCLKKDERKKIKLKHESITTIQSFFSQTYQQYFWENLDLYRNYKKKSA